MDPSLVKAIRNVPYYRESMYSDLDIAQTIEYMRKRFVAPMQNQTDISALGLVDCAAGFGWLSFSYLFSGGRRAILCDIDHERLEAAREIARILELDQRCEFICSPMNKLDFDPQSVGIFASIETLEHVGNQNIDECIQVMASATKRLIVLTTPNKLFPVIRHDTKIPFAHWLPKDLRRRYVRLFGKQDRAGNDFVSPLRLQPLRAQFQPVSTVLTFPSVAAWEASYPYHSPYGTKDRLRARPPVWLKAWYMLLATVLREQAYLLSPNLCSIWARKDTTQEEG
ncbi:MAG: class I SAM-dependent methyltransferase [Anaerolineae bacterium]|jgi:ubiquinone/menaquinone biosynthesis C-methylase UbiE